MVACMYLLKHVCVCCPQNQKKAPDPQELELTNNYEPACGYRELSLDPLQVFMLINTAPSLWFRS